MFLLLRVTSKASDHLQDCDPCVDFVHLVFEARVDLGSRTARCPRSPCTSGSWAPSPWSPWSPWAPSPWSTWALSSWSPWWTSPQLSSPRWPPVCRRGNGWRPPRLCTLSLLLCLVRPHNNHCEGLIVSFQSIGIWIYDKIWWWFLFVVWPHNTTVKVYLLVFIIRIGIWIWKTKMVVIIVSRWATQ